MILYVLTTEHCR